MRRRQRYPCVDLAIALWGKGTRVNTQRHLQADGGSLNTSIGIGNEVGLILSFTPCLLAFLPNFLLPHSLHCSFSLLLAIGPPLPVQYALKAQ